MRIEERDGLLFVSLVLTHKGVTHRVDNVILDTGAAQSLIDMNSLGDLDIFPEAEDEFVSMTGIGGKEPALRKRMDSIMFDTYTLNNGIMDFGFLDAHDGINGLLGADVLVAGKFVIDLEAMTVSQK